MKKFKSVILAMFSSMAIFLDISLFKSMNNANYNDFYNMNVLFISVMSIILYFIYIKNDDIKISKSKTFLTYLFSLFMIIGEVMVSRGNLNLITKNLFTLAFTIVKFIGYISLFNCCFIYLDKFLNNLKVKDFKVKNKYLKWYLDLFSKKPFTTSLITILLVWSIYFIAFYPIVLSPDPSFQIIQYYNVPSKYIDWVIQRNPNVYMTTHHPVLQTFLLGWCIDLGRSILDDNFGLFIYTVFQTLIYASTLAYTIKFADNNGVNKKLTIILLLMYLFVPMYGFYSVSAVKDTLYTSFMILFTLFVFDYVKNYQDKRVSVGKLVYLFLVMLLLSLFRHNGIYIMVLTFPFLFFFSKKNRVRILFPFLFFIVSMFGINKVLIPYLGISDGSIREMLSVPFQQTARYVKYYDKDLTKEDKKVIDKILDYDTLGKRYKPEIADPVKNKFNKYTTKDDLIKYFKVWFKGLKKRPLTYVNATLHNTFGYIYPNEHHWYIYAKYSKFVTKDNLVDYHYNKLQLVRQGLSLYANMFVYFPVIGLLASIGANTWALLILSAYLITNKKSKYLIVLVPLYGTFLFCLISPVNTYFRYTMPYVFVLPVLYMLLLNYIRGEKDEKK